MNYLIEDILPEGMISVRIGASGTGKTTWDLQTFEAASTGAMAFGRFNTRPLPPVWYVSLDRTENELEEKFASITIPSHLFKYRSYRAQLTNKYLLDKIFEEIPIGSKIIVLDGIGFVVEKVISQYHVGQVMAKLDALRTKADVTLSLIHHTPKTKMGEGYIDPREMGLGSGAWCQMAAASVVFRKVDPGDVANPFRRVWILQNNRPDQEFAFKLSNGRLEWLPNGLPVTELAKSWTIAEIAHKWGDCSEWLARKIWKRIQDGEEPADIEGGPKY